MKQVVILLDNRSIVCVCKRYGNDELALIDTCVNTCDCDKLQMKEVSTEFLIKCRDAMQKYIDDYNKWKQCSGMDYASIEIKCDRLNTRFNTLDEEITDRLLLGVE